VDNLLLTGPEEENKNVMDLIEKEFGDCKRKGGQEFRFIGMNFVMRDQGVFMKIDLKTLLQNTAGSVETPCGNNALSVKEDAEKLTLENKEKVHSVVAKLLYIAKRPEILFIVNF